ncbi:lipoprotein [Luteibacter aegosomaticola]|uniref:LPS translocon maturation chaperone LptM n=1 Tax=Luteibacter aegosomaticola TaxID=2911538 RepID=UPI001FFBAC91|nr:lipoprotein [Luteibacter aegosomaticola]UPG90160.1 lipoprotein [Luteibacter aegosomaticola]
MRRLILPLVLACAAAASLEGCGQKGNLFMPPPPAPGTTAKPATAPPQGHQGQSLESATSPKVEPARASTVDLPTPASTSMTPYNPIIHQ